MEILIIILILALIANTCVTIYAYFIDLSGRRETAANAESLKSAMVAYNEERQQFRKVLEEKDQSLKNWISEFNKLEFEASELRRANGLLRNRTVYVEKLKDSFNQVAELLWDGDYIVAKGKDERERLRFVKGVKAGAEWLADCVGVKVEFEIDDRYKETGQKAQELVELADITDAAPPQAVQEKADGEKQAEKTGSRRKGGQKSGKAKTN